MSKNNFKRTNVDVKQMEVSAPQRSSFDLSQNILTSVPFAKLFPVHCTKLVPGDTISGNVNPKLTLENFAVPAAGRMRLDTHTFLVTAKRIHKDYRKFIESYNSGNVQTLPAISLADCIDSIAYFYFNNPSTTSATVKKNFFQFYDTLSTDDQTTFANPTHFLVHMVDVVKSNLLAWSQYNNVELNNYRDFLALEHDRLATLYYSRLIGMLDPSSTSTYYIGDFMHDVFQTTLSEGSTLDMLGYDILSTRGLYVSAMNTVDLNNRNKLKGSGWTRLNARGFWNTMSNFSGEESTINCTFGQYTCLIWKKVLDSSTEYEPGLDLTLTPQQSEMFLRANYAVWYDYFRNYHLEKRENLLNPDNFTNTTVLKSSYSFINALSGIYMLMPRPRNWGRDAFTMVQPEDVYRHVYAPAAGNGGSATVSNQSNDQVFDANFDLIALFNDDPFSPSFSFPSWSFSTFGDSESFTTLYHDLQTMRRANMLEAYLRKNYYNPDTYIGYIEAQYGVVPEDFKIMVSQCLGGNESMINGEQVVSNITTDDATTVAGQRTLKADASVNGEFSYNTTEPAYLISYVSIVPIPHYDVRNPFLHELTPADQLIPAYANDNRIVIRTCDLMRNFNDQQQTMLGYVPRYYGYRIALDAVHGQYLNEKRSYSWLRDRYVYDQQLLKNQGLSMVTKDPNNEHIYMPLDCFLGLQPWDSVAYGEIDCPLFVERALPAKVEFI